MRPIALALAALITMTQAALADLGDDGLHKAPWMRDTFKDLSEDLAEANSEGKRMAIMVEQRGCIYCSKMHEEVYPIPEIADYIEENFFVVQINMFGDIEVTDFDGEALPEKEMVRKWGVLFTPTVLFMPETVAEDATAGPLGVIPPSTCSTGWSKRAMTATRAFRNITPANLPSKANRLGTKRF
jgi:hypothetical protein